MTGDLITKKLPKYKLEAMERIARLCFEELNTIIGLVMQILNLLLTGFRCLGLLSRLGVFRLK